jgi:acyl-CoA synthetase (AMP-forming)/AMP-acid ligase II
MRNTKPPTSEQILPIVRASNTSPEELEESLYHHPAVLEACVVGMPDPVHDEELIAFVASRDGPAESFRKSVLNGRSRSRGRCVRSMPNGDRLRCFEHVDWKRLWRHRREFTTSTKVSARLVRTNRTPPSRRRIIGHRHCRGCRSGREGSTHQVRAR